MKKYLKVTALLTALLLIGFLIYIIDLFTGYPISYFRVKKTAEHYIEEIYSDMDYTLSKPAYSLKSGGFTYEASLPSSIDNHFSISFYSDGTLKYDTYEQDVLNKMNTAIRLSNNYHAKIRDVFENSDFPFAADINGNFQSAITGDKEQQHEPGVYPEKWNIQELIIDGEYDISNISDEYGTLDLIVTSRDVSAKTAAESLIKLKDIMEKNNLPFKSADLWILSEKTDDFGNPIDKLHILNFGWDEIYETDLENRLEKAIAETEKYYNK